MMLRDNFEYCSIAYLVKMGLVPTLGLQHIVCRFQAAMQLNYLKMLPADGLCTFKLLPTALHYNNLKFKKGSRDRLHIYEQAKLESTRVI